MMENSVLMAIMIMECNLDMIAFLRLVLRST